MKAVSQVGQYLDIFFKVQYSERMIDLAFADSHAIWAQHASGAFSQIDLRDATKPVDAIPRVTATWEATGSLAFVTEKKDPWEIPYDDL